MSSREQFPGDRGGEVTRGVAAVLAAIALPPIEPFGTDTLALAGLPLVIEVPVPDPEPASVAGVARGVYDEGLVALGAVKVLEDALWACKAALLARVMGAAVVEGAAVGLDSWQRGVMEASTVTHVSMVLGLPERTAASLVHHSSELVSSYPRILAGIAAGLFSFRHATIMVDEFRVLDDFGAVDSREREVFQERLLGFAGGTTVASFAGKARRARERMFPGSMPVKVRDAFRKRSLSCDAGKDGMSWLTLYLPTMAAEAIYTRCTRMGRAAKSAAAKAQREAEQAGSQGDCTEYRTLAQLRVDIAAALLLGQPTATATDTSASAGTGLFTNNATSKGKTGQTRPRTGTGSAAHAGGPDGRGGSGFGGSSGGSGPSSRSVSAGSAAGPGTAASASGQGGASSSGGTGSCGGGFGAAGARGTGAGSATVPGRGAGRASCADLFRQAPTAGDESSPFNGVQLVGEEPPWEHGNTTASTTDSDADAADTDAGGEGTALPEAPETHTAPDPELATGPDPAAAPAPAPGSDAEAAPTPAPAADSVGSPAAGLEGALVGELVGDGSGFINYVVDGIKEDPQGEYLAQLDALSRSKTVMDPPLPKALVLLTVPVLGLLGITDEPAELAGPLGGPVPENIARKLLAGSSTFLRVLTDPVSGQALPAQPERYTLKDAEKAVLQTLAGHCYVPNCPNPVIDADLDHLRAFEFGGESSLENLRPTCKRHHAMKHFKDDKDRHGQRRAINEPARARLRLRGWTPQPTSDGRIGWITPSGTYQPPPAEETPRPRYPKWLKKLITNKPKKHP